MTPRWLHPGAWWVWALGLAAAASRTTNPLLLALILAVVALVVTARKPDAPWARSFRAFLTLGLVVIVVRVVFQMVFGAAMGVTVLLTLPSVALPDWMAGVRLGGEVTAEGLLLALYDGFRLAVLLACVGAANSLASPARLLKSVPAALYEVGVAVVIALTFAPMLISDIERVRTAQRLRGRPHRGIRAIAASAIPVFEGALDRSVSLAAAMDSRGYGRRAASLAVPPRPRCSSVSWPHSSGATAFWTHRPRPHSASPCSCSASRSPSQACTSPDAGPCGRATARIRGACPNGASPPAEC